MTQSSSMFDGYVAVDWSARARPARGSDSVWIAVLLPGNDLRLENPWTRKSAIHYIDELLTHAKRSGLRLLCGFDFPFGYPEGTAKKLTGQDDWKAVWELLGQEISDSSRNLNNRFEVAAKLNGSFDDDGPFWGNPTKHEFSGLPKTRPVDGWGQSLPPRRRHADIEFPHAKEVWQLNGAGSVGGQALTGIAAANPLRMRDDVQVWPFETFGEGQCHVLAEIYPSLIDPMPGNDVKDKRQAHAVVVRLREMDVSGLLRERLRDPVEMPDAVCREEGLFLDIS